MTRDEFTYYTNCKGETFTNVVYKFQETIRNKSLYCVFYKGEYIGKVETKKDAEKFIANLIKYNKLTYTQEYRLGDKLLTAEEYKQATGFTRRTEA